MQNRVAMMRKLREQSIVTRPVRRLAFDASRPEAFVVAIRIQSLGDVEKLVCVEERLWIHPDPEIIRANESCRARRGGKRNPRESRDSTRDFLRAEGYVRACRAGGLSSTPWGVFWGPAVCGVALSLAWNDEVETGVESCRGFFGGVVILDERVDELDELAMEAVPPANFLACG